MGGNFEEAQPWLCQYWAAADSWCLCSVNRRSVRLVAAFAVTWTKATSEFSHRCFMDAVHQSVTCDTVCNHVRARVTDTTGVGDCYPRLCLDNIVLFFCTIICKEGGKGPDLCYCSVVYSANCPKKESLQSLHCQLHLTHGFSHGSSLLSLLLVETQTVKVRCPVCPPAHRKALETGCWRC